MKSFRLQLEPLTAEAFEPFGQVIQREGVNAEEINEGMTLKHADLVRVDSCEGGGNPAVHLFRSRSTALPITVDRLECHPLGSQAFMPLQNLPFPVIVAPPGTEPDVQSIRAFITNGKQGVNYDRGVWHHYQLSLYDGCEYLVIDRAGPGNNFEEWVLERPLIIGQVGTDSMDVSK